MKALIVHDSDAVKACFIGETDEAIIAKLKVSKYWEDIKCRARGGAGELPEEEIVMEDIDGTPHDGDSEDGYTLIDAI